MKKISFKKLALLGIASGLCATLDIHAIDTKPATKEETDPNAGNLGYHLMTEDEFLLELNDEGYNLYMGLTPEGKALAREVASSRCNGTNKCKGLNACATSSNACAGQGSCEGKGKCGISDKNLAVKLAAKKMGDKRVQISKPAQ